MIQCELSYKYLWLYGLEVSLSEVASIGVVDPLHLERIGDQRHIDRHPATQKRIPPFLNPWWCIQLYTQFSQYTVDLEYTIQSLKIRILLEIWVLEPQPVA